MSYDPTDGLNPEQKKAATAQSNTVITACPGSGKTKTLEARAAWLLQQDASSTVLAVTFTRDAAAELKSRILRSVGKEASSSVGAGTFHSIAQLQLKRAGIRPKLIREYQRRDLIRQGLATIETNLGLEEAVAFVDEIKSSDGNVSSKASAAFGIYTYYQEALTQLGLMDFADLLIEAVKGMRQGTIQPMGASHLLVDEYQDADPLQDAWVQCHADAGACVTIVGDDDQSIYGWRSAMGIRGMQQFAKRNAASLHVLHTNYRSLGNILTHAGKLIEKNLDRIPKKLKPHRGTGGQIQVQRFTDKPLEALAIQKAVADQPGQWAVLSRTNNRLDAVEAMLQGARVPYRRVGGKSWLSYDYMQATLSILESVANGDGRRAEGALAFCSISDQTKKWIRHSNMLSADSGYDASHLPTSAEASVRTLVRGLSAWRSQEADGETEAAINAATTWCRINIPEMMGPKKAEVVERMIRTLALVLSTQLEGTLSQRVAKLMHSRKDETGEDDKNRVALMTLHASKGLEFPNVWMCAVEDKVLPFEDSPLDEERRLCYVGMTRAENKLVMSCAMPNAMSAFILEAELGDLALMAA